MHAQIRRFRHAGMTLVGLVLALMIVVPAAQADLYNPADWAPMVWSDKADYAPGELVTLSGAHWTPGETVNIVVNDDEGNTWSRDINVTAGDDGTISDQFNLPSWFVASYSVRATDASSRTATWSFTDSRLITAATLNGGTSASVTPGASISARVDVTTDNAGGNQNWRSTGWRIATSAPGSVTCVNHLNHDGSGSYTETFNATAPLTLGTYNAYFIAYSDDDCKNQASSTFTVPGGGVTVKNNQTINNFPALANRTYGDADVQLNATASSGESVSYSAEGQCTVTADTVHITAAGSCKVTASQAGNASYHAAPPISHTFEIAKRLVTVTADAKSKVYDDNDPALTYKVTSGSLVSGDSFSGALTRAAGNTVAGSPYAIQRGTLTAGGNYDLTFVGANLSITKKGLVVAGAAAQHKTYDGTKAATVDFSHATLPGVVAGDAVSLDHSASQAEFASADVGTGKPVTVTGVALAGAAAGNYSLAQPTGLKADITALALTGSFTADNKVYDGNRDATVASKSLPGTVEDDEVALVVSEPRFDSKVVGTGKDVVGGLSLSGADAGNYSVNGSHTAKADITAHGADGQLHGRQQGL